MSVMSGEKSSVELESETNNEMSASSTAADRHLDRHIDRHLEPAIKPILKRKSLDECEVKVLPSILKKRDSLESFSHSLTLSSTHSQPILKRHSLGSESDHRNGWLSAIASVSTASTPAYTSASNASTNASTSADNSVSIFASTSASTSASRHSVVHPILKHRSLDEKTIKYKDEQSLPKPILKKKLSIEDQIERCVIDTNGSANKTKSILKTAFDCDKKSTVMSSKTEVRGILKIAQTNNSLPVKSALKKSDQITDSKCETKSILKPESIGSSDANSSESSSSDEEANKDACDANDESHSKNDSCDSHLMRLTTANRSDDDFIESNKDDQKRDIIKRHFRQNIDNKKLETSNDEDLTPFLGICKSATQPIISENELKLPLKKFGNDSTGGSISQRLAALKRNGEENWKKRISYNKSDDADVALRVPSINSNKQRYSSITDRVSLLEDSSIQWRNRVEEKDVSQFTVAGKMKQTDTPIIKTPEIKKRTPKALPFRSQINANNMSHLLPSVSLSPSNNENNVEVNCQTRDSAKQTVVSIPQLDDETFTSFFPKVSNNNGDSSSPYDDEAFDNISTQTTNLLVHKKSVRVQNRRSISSNPIKKLANRGDFIVDSYIEVNKLDKEKLSSKPKKQIDLKNSKFAASALAGLASREDYKAVADKLRSSTSTRYAWKSYEMPNSSQAIMLVQVKGRRKAQTRLVEPIFTSISSGDSYILANKDKLYVWIGQFSNVIERTRALEMANQIHKKKDLCFRSSNDVIVIDNQNENIDNSIESESFFNLLNKKESDLLKAPGSPDEDEQYEDAIIGTNLVYQVCNEELVPQQDYWGRVPHFEMLTTEEAFVFDFGTEMYFWVGKLASNEKRKSAYDLAKQLWNQGYNYSDCDINPIGSSYSSRSDKRPHWAWITKANQNMESVLFKDKFFDWPNAVA